MMSDKDGYSTERKKYLIDLSDSTCYDWDSFIVKNKFKLIQLTIIYF
jgi:hypothetical protein